jgi:pyridoxal phosphate enzyme (YggS family)
MADVGARLEVVRAAIGALKSPASVRLVAVSKTKPAEMLMEAYERGHRSFGENYVQELVEKSKLLPADVQWHFIGHLQSNKCGLIAQVPNLSMVETVDSQKLAEKLDKAWGNQPERKPLKVMIQVNTSSEQSKAGVAPNETVSLAEYIASSCLSLRLAGLMTIGFPDYSGCRSEDFECLHKCREQVADALKQDLSSLELSMGMSNDFEEAVRNGSTSVRVGSTIFGARAAKAAST